LLSHPLDTICIHVHPSATIQMNSSNWTRFYSRPLSTSAHIETNGSRKAVEKQRGETLSSFSEWLSREYSIFGPSLTLELFKCLSGFFYCFSILPMIEGTI
jgi:hypothetical protein